MKSSTSSQPNQPYSPINPTNLDMNFEELLFTKAKKDEVKEVKEPPKEWTVDEEVALCQGWCDVSENNISGNSMKAKGYWEAVI
ncbi:hypothetical protein Tco_0055879, partial [Tanacetum coccineum]